MPNLPSNDKINRFDGIDLKVPKRENFLLAFFALSEPIWEEDLGTKKKKFCLHLTSDFDRFWFFDAYRVCGKSKKNFS
jgi:hypothetical protein